MRPDIGYFAERHTEHRMSFPHFFLENHLDGGQVGWIPGCGTVHPFPAESLKQMGKIDQAKGKKVGIMNDLAQSGVYFPFSIVVVGDGIGQAGGKGGTRRRRLVLAAPKVRGKGEPWHRRGKREVLTRPVSNRGVPCVQARLRPENGRTKTQLATQSQETQAGSTLAA